MSVGKKEELAGLENAEIVRFSESSFNFGAVFIYVAAVLSCVGTFMFWSMDRGQKSILVEKQQEKDTIIAEITSPTYKEIEKKASDFKSAFTELQSAQKDRYSFVKFIPELFKHMNQDVKLTALSIDSNGKLSVTGTTNSYRGAADQFLALKSWKTLTDVTLGAVTFSVDKSGRGTVPVTITATVDKAAEAASTTADAASTGTNETTSQTQENPSSASASSSTEGNAE